MSLERNIDTYREEKISLLKNKKDNLLKELKKINERLEKSDTINEFLIKQINECVNEKENPITIKDKCLTFFIIKIIGTIFVTLYLIGVFEIINMMNAVLEEITSSIRLFFIKENDEQRTDFYHNFINFAIQIPSFSPFYLSSLLSNILMNVFEFYFLTIIVIAICILTICFGINNFSFHDKTLLEENYTLKEFLSLILIYLCFYISIGFVALVPFDIIQEGFKKYDQKKSNDLKKMLDHFTAKVYAKEHAEEEGYGDDEEKYKEKLIELKEVQKKRDENMKENILNKKAKDLDLNERIYYNLLLDYKMEINGFLLFYLISMTISSIFVIIYNRIFLLNYSEYNRNIKSLYYILSFSVPMILSLFFYKVYTLVFGEENTTQNKKIDIIKFGGYIIYQEKYISNENCCCSLCSDCSESLEKLNYGCCCQLCSCTYICKSLICCKCSCDNNIREKIATNDVNKEKICVVYKINGICSWLTSLLTNPRILIFVPMLYIINSLNIAFPSVIAEDSDNIKTITLNIITLSSRFIFFIINYFGGKALNVFFQTLEEKKDFYIIIYGIVLILIFESIFSAIISIFINFDLISGNLRDYLITISIESTEYMEIVCLEYFSLYFQINLALGDFLSNSSILTFYLTIWELFALIMNIIIKVKYLFIFQFVFGIVLSIVLIIFTICIRLNSNSKGVLTDLVDKFDV